MLFDNLSPTALPLSHQSSSGPTRAADVDAEGRRAGARDPDDGNFNDKDILPAYDTRGGPPRYVELEMRARLQALAAGNERPMEEENTVSTCDNVPRILDDDRERAERLGRWSRASFSTMSSQPRPPSAMSRSSLTLSAGAHG
jgi:hypothetical protein